ncbi:MAG: signal peptidase I [Candidatus Yanofskybacteria bacterium]|nr:signal peptidase I [Candidatus Yanofskybacteria bacterium]
MRHFSLLSIALFCGFGVFFAMHFLALENSESPQTISCDFRYETKTVRGNSLSGVIESGEDVQIYYNYYQCANSSVARNNLVIYQNADGREFIKLAKGLPGDVFTLKKTEMEWNMLINGEILRNSEGRAYTFNQQAYRMLSLYERDYNGVIPENAYLLLGNLSGGSMDSTRFGLVHRSNIVGKAELYPIF